MRKAEKSSKFGTEARLTRVQELKQALGLSAFFCFQHSITVFNEIKSKQTPLLSHPVSTWVASALWIVLWNLCSTLLAAVVIPTLQCSIWWALMHGQQHIAFIKQLQVGLLIKLVGQNLLMKLFDCFLKL